MNRLTPIIIYLILIVAVALISAYSIETYPDCHTDTECEATDGRYGEGY